MPLIGKNRHRITTTRLLVAVAAAILAIQPVVSASARVVNVVGFIKFDTVHANEGIVVYNFSGDNRYSISSDVDVQLTLSIGTPLKFQHVNVTINASSDLTLIIQNLEFWDYPWADWFEDDYDGDGNLTRFDQIWGSYIFFWLDEPGTLIELAVPIGAIYNISATDKWTANLNGTWQVLPSAIVDGRWLTTSVVIEDSTNFFSIFSSNETVIEPEDPPVDPPVDPGDPDGDDEAILKQQRERGILYASVGAIVFAVVLVVASISFTGKEYREYIKSRATRDVETNHKLTIDEVLENENRVVIIDEILKEPGIHFNELMRRTSLAPGNLVWHLEILCQYKVIGKKSVGQYVVYYPFSSANPLKDIDITLVKSKVTLQVLNIIESEPGIYGNVIAKRLGLDHKTVKYHVDKLIEAKLVTGEKEGRTRKLTPCLPISPGLPPKNP